jgi:hypothetical protein
MKGNSNAALISLALIHLCLQHQESSSVTAFASFSTSSSTSINACNPMEMSMSMAMGPSILAASSYRNVNLHSRASHKTAHIDIATRVNVNVNGRPACSINTHTTRRNTKLFASPSENETESSTSSTSSSTSTSSMTSFEKLKSQANKMKLEAEKLEAELNLSKINKLEAAIKASESLKDDDAKAKTRLDIRSQIKALASRVDPSLLSSLEDAVGIVRGEPVSDSKADIDSDTLLASAMQDALKEDDSPLVTTQTNLYAKRRSNQPTITEEELTAAILYYATLPVPMRRALAKSIDLDERMAAPAIIVLGLYELAGSLSDEMLARLYQQELLEQPLTNDKSINGNTSNNKSNTNNS